MGFYEGEQQHSREDAARKTALDVVRALIELTNNSPRLQEAICYTIATLAVATAIGLDQINTARARNTAAETDGSELVAEQTAAETGVVRDILGGREVDIEAGTVAYDGMCLIDPIVRNGWYVLIRRDNVDDPDSLRAYVIGPVDSTSPRTLESAAVDWAAGRDAYVVASPSSLYHGLAVGTGLVMEPGASC